MRNVIVKLTEVNDSNWNHDDNSIDVNTFRRWFIATRILASDDFDGRSNSHLPQNLPRRISNHLHSPVWTSISISFRGLSLAQKMNGKKTSRKRKKKQKKKIVSFFIRFTWAKLSQWPLVVPLLSFNFPVKGNRRRKTGPYLPLPNCSPLPFSTFFNSFRLPSSLNAQPEPSTFICGWFGNNQKNKKNKATSK